jgi:hypothetical protein
LEKAKAATDEQPRKRHLVGRSGMVDKVIGSQASQRRLCLNCQYPLHEVFPMKRQMLFLVASILMVNAQTPAQAKATNDADYNKATIQERESQRFLRSKAIIPLNVLKVGAAVTCATPIFIGRSLAYSTAEYGKNMKEEFDANESLTPTMVASLPGQALSTLGTVKEALLISAIHARNSWDRPFSAATFGLKDPDLFR